MFKFVFTGFILFNTLCANAQWKKIYTPANQDLYDVQMLNHIGYAVGYSSTILKTIDTGKSWKTLSLPAFLNCRSVYFIDTNLGFVTGENARMLKTTDGGKNWTQKYIQTAAYAYSIKFNGANGIAVGNNLLALRSNNYGESWQSDTTFSTKKKLNSVCILPNGKCWAVGDSGYVLYKNITDKKWQKQAHITPINLNYITHIGDSIIMISGGMQDTVGGVSVYKNILMYSYDSGISWQQAAFNEMKIINKAWHLNKDTAFFVGNSGLISKSYNLLTNRAIQLTGTANALNAISFAQNVGIAVGDGGTLLRTNNGGGFRLNSLNIANNNLQVFPNPSKGEINISMDKEIKAIYVFDNKGNAIKYIRKFNQTIQIEQNGVYYVQILDSAEHIFTYKITIIQ